MTEPRRRGRPRSTGGRECARCHNLVSTIRTTWPEGPICGPCFTAAARTYGLCAFCGAQRLLPGRSATGQNICRDCAAITTNLDCDNCGREAERRRGGHCARCVLTGDLEQILKPHAPPDMRIKRLVKPGLGYFSFETAWRTLQGYEAMHMMRKGQVNGVAKGDSRGQVLFIATLFGVAA